MIHPSGQTYQQVRRPVNGCSGTCRCAAVLSCYAIHGFVEEPALTLAAVFIICDILVMCNFKSFQLEVDGHACRQQQKCQMR